MNWDFMIEPPLVLDEPELDWGPEPVGAVTTDLAMEPCPRCGRRPTVLAGYVEYTVACDNCYDGADDSGTAGEIVSAPTVELAVAAWNERQEGNER